MTRWPSALAQSTSAAVIRILRNSPPTIKEASETPSTRARDDAEGRFCYCPDRSGVAQAMREGTS